MNLQEWAEERIDISESGVIRRFFAPPDSITYSFTSAEPDEHFVCMQMIHNYKWVVCTYQQRKKWHNKKETPPDGYDSPEAAIAAWKIMQ